jgi:hypothetical protein
LSFFGRLGDDWRAQLFSTFAWQQDASRPNPGEAGGFFVTCPDVPRRAYLKPTRICGDDHPRAANEKIVSDLAAELDLAVPPVLLFRRPACPAGEESRTCVSLVPFDEFWEWSEFYNLAPTPSIQAVVRGLLARGCGVIALDAWVGNTDRDNGRNAGFGNSVAAPAESTFLFLDHANALNHGHRWQVPANRTVAAPNSLGRRRRFRTVDASPDRSTECRAVAWQRQRGFSVCVSRWALGGFFAGGFNGELKKVAITGGPPITLCRFQGAARGASWGPDDTIVFATSDLTTGLMSVPAAGGEPKVLTKPDAIHGEQDHVFPAWLPDRRSVLYTVLIGSTIDTAQVAVLDLETGQRTTLIRGGSDAQYVHTGHLVYASAGTLRAVRFDLARRTVLSDPELVVEQVTMLATGAADFGISEQGTLAYVTGSPAILGARSLVWVNRQGQQEPIDAPSRPYFFARLSPDGTRVALDIRDQDNDIWIWEFARKTLTRLTADPALDSNPVWTPDGRRIAFSSARAGVQNLFWQAANGTGAVERLTTNLAQQLPTSFSPDGKTMIFMEMNTKTGGDLMQLHLDGSPKAEPLIQTNFGESNGEVSPDGRWIAYQSNESGQNEVYVRPFPKVDGGRWQISTGGGSLPVWSRNGRELFYYDPNTAMMAVPVQTSPGFSAGNPSKLFGGRWYALQAGRTYDPSPDGQRFLMIKDTALGDQNTPSAPINVVVHWTEELKARVPAK